MRVILEENKRLSRSLLWDMQRRFFHQQGVNAWSAGIVPHYITSNPFMAWSYAHVVFGWLRDVAETLDRKQPVYIVELGAGSGRLAYHFLQAFFSLLDTSALRGIPVTYVLTDYAEVNLTFWQQQPQLEAWVKRGRLDFALFDVEQDSTFSLIESGVVLGAADLSNPLTVVANYFFDGLTCDTFYVRDDTLYENLVSLTLSAEHADMDPGEMLSHVDVAFDLKPLPAGKLDYYTDPDLNAVLDHYRQTLDASYVVVPTAALACIRLLREISNDQMLLITADKGFHREIDVYDTKAPTLAVHGSFSMMVNYH
ncbi:MAG: SAM-dependent methyltransferase, partial [Chloroflexota bacterium]